jgi:hypothetical protein
MAEVSPTDLRAARSAARAELEALRAESRTFFAEQVQAEVWWAQERLRIHQSKDAAILSALRQGATVRRVCESLEVGQHRVVRLRAALRREASTVQSQDNMTPANPPRAR